jgi:hypothetical protein
MTARARWPDADQSIEWIFLGQPCGTDGANPYLPEPISRVHQGDRCGPLMGNPERAMPRTLESGERKRAIGAHLPNVADIALAAGLAARLAVRFKPTIPADFNPGRDLEPFAPVVGLPVEGTTVPMLGSRSRTQGSSRPTRSAGLGSVSTQTSTATQPCGIVTRLNGCCNCWENEPGMAGIASVGLEIEDTTYHTILSRMTS